MLIDLSKLNKDFSYNTKAENAVAVSLCYNYNLLFNEHSVGLNSQYDCIINGKKVEIKIQSGGAPIIEYMKYDGTPSGITLSEADVYMVLNPGMSAGTKFMKVRLYNTAYLRQWIDTQLKTDAEPIVYKPDGTGPGSYNFKLPIGRGCPVPDLYVLGFPVSSYNGTLQFDTTVGVESRAADSYVMQALCGYL